MLKRRIWFLEGVAHDQYLGLVSANEQTLDRVEKALNLGPEDRWSEDTEMLMPEIQVYHLTLETGTIAPYGEDWRPITHAELSKCIKAFFKFETLPDALAESIENLKTSNDPAEWNGERGDHTVRIKPLGPLNFNTL